MGLGRTRRKGKNTTAPPKAEDEENPILPNIPEEIVLEILPWLPLNSLARFTCVSKQWRLYTSTVQPKTARHKVVVLSQLKNDSFLFHSVDEESKVESLCGPWKDELYYSQLQICGSCNGLLLLRLDLDLFLWNPLTRYCKKVLSYYRFEDIDYTIVSGLCYDSSTNQYKAVMALSHYSPDDGGEFVVVASFKNKSWNTIPFPYIIKQVNSGPVVNEHLHWFVSKENDPGYNLLTNYIIYFDSNTNNFKELPLPQPKHKDGDFIVGLGCLDGCLSMVRYENPIHFEGNVEVLVMKKNGIEVSWTVLFVINYVGLENSEDLVPLCYMKNGEVIMASGMDIERRSHLNVYNPYEKSHRMIRIPTKHTHFHAVMYEESLVAPTGYTWEEEELRGEVSYVEDSQQVILRDGYWTVESDESEEYSVESSDLEELEEEYSEESSDSEESEDECSEESSDSDESEDEEGSDWEELEEEI